MPSCNTLFIKGFLKFWTVLHLYVPGKHEQTFCTCVKMIETKIIVSIYIFCLEDFLSMRAHFPQKFPRSTSYSPKVNIKRLELPNLKHKSHLPGFSRAACRIQNYSNRRRTANEGTIFCKYQQSLAPTASGIAMYLNSQL